MTTSRFVKVLAALALFAAAACSDSKSGSTTNAVAPAERVGEVNGWQKVVAPSTCVCSDNSAFNFFVHRGDPTKVLFYLEGGGACFSASTCGPPKPSFNPNLVGDDGPAKDGPKGIFDFANRANPFADYSVVFVPYCTGDVHLGNAVHDYGDGVVVHHNGYINASTALAATATAFPGAKSVVVAGGSAGSAGSPLYAGLAHDAFPKAHVSLIADGSGAYPATEAITAAIGALWGTTSAIPPWPENVGLAPNSWTLPGIVVQAAKHDPDLTVAIVNTAYDETQTDFVKKVGINADDLGALIDDNTKLIESKGVKVHSWVGPGTLHTILTRPQFYTDTVEGTSVRDWVADLITGKDAPDVHCKDCKKPA